MRVHFPRPSISQTGEGDAWVRSNCYADGGSTIHQRSCADRLRHVPGLLAVPHSVLELDGRVELLPCVLNGSPRACLAGRGRGRSSYSMFISFSAFSTLQHAPVLSHSELAAMELDGHSASLSRPNRPYALRTSQAVVAQGAFLNAGPPESLTAKAPWGSTIRGCCRYTTGDQRCRDCCSS